MTNKDVYEKVNQTILGMIEKGVMPWQITWDSSSLPTNRATEKNYRGVNVWLLSAVAMEKGYAHNQWLTYNQAQSLGGQVRKGEKSTFVVFAKRIEKKGQENIPEDEREGFFIWRYYNVFNVAQVDGIEPIIRESCEATPNEMAEKIVEGYKNRPEIVYGDFNPAYSPLSDKVQMPVMEAFESIEEYYGTLFHELAHSTGHESRLNRNLLTGSYSKEEMIAEFSASYLRATAGLASPKADENSASYIDGWSKAIGKDYRIVMNSASIAMKVAEYILGEGK